MPDAIKLLKDDHRKVEGLFEQFQKSPDADAKVVEQICNELTVHALIEEEVLYPLLPELPNGEQLRQEAEQEHQEAKQSIAQIEAAGYDPAQAGPVVEQLIESVNHHVEEEENEVFKTMRDTWGDKRLTELGEQLAAAKVKHLKVVGNLEDLSREELYEMAQVTGVEGRSGMNKDELIKALQGA